MTLIWEETLFKSKELMRTGWECLQPVHKRFQTPFKLYEIPVNVATDRVRDLLFQQQTSMI